MDGLGFLKFYVVVNSFSSLVNAALQRVSLCYLMQFCFVQFFKYCKKNFTKQLCSLHKELNLEEFHFQ